jgi:hypothetical protein
MDGPTWNAYQIVGNRARAMCYATQQNQFRRLTEMAVHDLVSAADDQLQSMKQIMVDRVLFSLSELKSVGSFSDCSLSVVCCLSICYTFSFQILLPEPLYQF